MSSNPSSSSDAHLAAFATALQGISPGLAALHTSRLRLRNPDLVSPNTCIRCGHRSVDVRSRVCRKAKNKANIPQRVIERTCSACQFIHQMPITRGNASLFPAARKTKSRSTEPDLPLVPLVEQSAPSLPPPSPTTHARRSDHTTGLIPKRNKKKPGLQELLARNRQKQEQEVNRFGASRGKPGSLSSFLDAL